MTKETSTSTSTGVASMPTKVYDASFASMSRPWVEAIEPSTQGDALAHHQKTALAVDKSLPCRRAPNHPSIENSIGKFVTRRSVEQPSSRPLAMAEILGWSRPGTSAACTWVRQQALMTRLI